jgi:hypothetical protein
VTPLEFLTQFDDVGGFSKKSLVLIFAYYLRKDKGRPEFTASDIRRCFRDALINPPSKLGPLLASLAKGKTSVLIRGTSSGRYSLSLLGLKEVEDALARKLSSPEVVTAFLETAIPYLQKTIAKVKEEDRRAFLAEAISCIGVQARRATIIMTWIAVLDHLYEYILAKRAADFNATLRKRRDRYASLTIATKDDFADIKESAFIEIARSAGIVTNDVRKILDEKLGIRNTCAHPSTVVIHDSKVIGFIEDLVDNVVAKYPLA